MTTTETTPRPLTERQREILAWLVTFISKNGFSPTIREMCLAFNFSSPNGAACHLDALASKGWITWNQGKSRTLKVLEVAT
jgi:repressor LexA